MIDILVVEDEAPIREWLVYTISNLSSDFNVVGSATNGKEGYELAVKLKPDVILTDIKMPIMSGIDLAREIKKVDKDVKIIISTNYAEFEYARQAITYGVYEYLVKSDITPKELKALLNSIFENIKKDNKNNDNIKAVNVGDEDKELVKGYKNETDTIKNSHEKEYSKSIRRSLEYIEENYKEHISLGDISNYVYLSHEYFSRLFKEEVGENFSTYLNNYRIKKAEKLLKNTDKKISEIAAEVGFVNAGYFSKTYKKYQGVSPDDDRY